jgi:methionyl-tRNA synthetase
MSKKYITTPIYYVNGDPHVGHAHTTIMADILKRAERMRGKEVMMTTGTDEHGQKNQESAEAAGLQVGEFLDRQTKLFSALFDNLSIEYDAWIRTSSEAHKVTVQKALQYVYDKGEIIKKEYTGLYCVGCEQFKKTSDLDDEGLCPDHKVKPVESTEVNYFFPLGKYQQWLIAEIEKREDWIKPDVYRREILGMLREPLDDLCISRPKTRVKLGVELPFDPDYVTYVWFDALLNYITSLDWATDFKADYWSASTHLMAKDIIKTHCIYWPIMLKALDVPLPERYRVHGYWVAAGGAKMSKSLDNAVDPVALLEKIGSDSLRFYVAKTMHGGDAQISNEMAVGCHNSDLANNLGNLYSRVVNLFCKHCDGVFSGAENLNADDIELRDWVVDKANNALDEIDMHTIDQYTQTLVTISDRLNMYVNDNAPWKLVKDPEKLPRAKDILHLLVDCLRVLFEMAWPVMPVTSQKALDNLGCELIVEIDKPHVFKAEGLQKGGAVGSDAMLFPRIKD